MLVDMVDALASDDAFAGYLSDLTEELDETERQIEYYYREEEIKHLHTIGRTAELDEIDAIYDKVGQLEATLHSDTGYKRYASIKARIEDLLRHKERTLSATDPAAVDLLGALSRVSGINIPDHLPPFGNYKDNTGDTWQYTSDASVKNYLDSLCFVDTNGSRLDGNSVSIHSGYGQTISVPLSLFVDAAGFESWKGRSDDNKKSWYSREYGTGGGKSIDAIRHYAALPTDLPPVELVNVYVQPDGFMFANNNAGDSHRIGAAFLRGQDKISTEAVRLVRLTQNYLQYIVQ